MIENIRPTCRVHGQARFCHVSQPDASGLQPGLWRPVSSFAHNDVLYDWATVLAELLRGEPDGKRYRLSAAYLEFENNGGVAVSTPAVTRGAGLSYYDALESHPTQDYLRVPIAAMSLGSTDETLFPRGNKLTVLAVSSGSVGVHGKAFSAANQSRVFGAALVAAPVWDDPTQDLVFSRLYREGAAQLVKLASSEAGVEWQVNLL